MIVKGFTPTLIIASIVQTMPDFAPSQKPSITIAEFAVNFFIGVVA